VKRYSFLHAWLLIILLSAAFLRFCGIDWDDGIGAHPDERYVVSVAEGLHWPERPSPFAVSSDYAYGHFPVYLLAVARGLDTAADPLFLGRVLAALFDVGTVALTFSLGRHVWGDQVGLVSAGLVALLVLHVQQAHFYTADAPLAFFVIGTILFAARVATRGAGRDACLAGMCFGLAMATKFSAALLVLPLGAACIATPGSVPVRWRLALRVGISGILVFALTSPFALVSFPVFWHNVLRESAIARGAFDVPYTRQFHATWPYVYPLLQLLRWAMVWPLGLMALGGFALEIWRVMRKPIAGAAWVLLVWALPFFVVTGALYTKFPRYWLPLTPILAIYAARLLRTCYRRVPRLAQLLAGVSLIWGLFWSLAFVKLYVVPHPWQTASTWIRDHASVGSVIAVEHWDHPLPVGGLEDYEVRELAVFDPDVPAKWAEMRAVLSEADYVIVASRRGYATLPRWTERYPQMARYYRQLFTGELGFEPVACLGRYPRLGSVVFLDDPTRGLDFALPELCHPPGPALWLGRLDESYVVYDHPMVIVFGRAP
jgi:4-amino-4-deoxy-L-arabinose transferase-like glycosyltransferase